jgi:hypothetical protein
MKATFSTQDINSYGFRVITAGIILSRYLKNPVITSEHDIKRMSIGKALGLSVENNNLVGDIEFDLEDELGKALNRKYEKGFMNGFSVSLSVIKFDWEKDIPELMESELIEITAATIPSNENAVKLFNDKGEIVELSYFNKNLKDMKKIAILLALAENATEQEIEKAVGELKAFAAAKEAEVQSLSAQLKAVKDVERAEKTARLELALNNPKKNLSDAQKSDYKKLAENDIDTVISIVNNLSEAASLHTIPGQRSTNKYEGKAFSQLQKEAPGYLAELRANDYEAFAALYKAEFGKDPKKQS